MKPESTQPESTPKGFTMPGLNTQIVIGAILGILIGFSLNDVSAEAVVKTNTLYWAGIFSQLFVDLLKMILVPLIFTSIVVGVTNLGAHTQGSSIWRHTLLFFVMTMILAMVTALVVTGWVKPGSEMNIDMFAGSMTNFQAKEMTAGEFLQHLLHSFFLNPIQAMANGKVLPVVVFAIFLGVALLKRGSEAEKLTGLFQELLAILMQIIGWIMKLAPLGVMALLTKLLATQDTQLLQTMATFITLVFLITLFHGTVTLPSLLWLFTRKSPISFWRGARPALITAFATSSSAATLPISMKCATEELGVKKEVAGFVLPIGATINMDGTALYEASAALFIAYLVGVDLSIGAQLIVMITAMVASMGAPGIPSAGMVTMVMVLQAVGLPAEAIAILLPIDRILDTVRTAVNVEGDLITATIVGNKKQI